MKELRSPTFKAYRLEAIRDGRMTQTRRVMKPQPFCPGGKFVADDVGDMTYCPVYFNTHDEPGYVFKPPYGLPGDVWALREPLRAWKHIEGRTVSACYEDVSYVKDRRTGEYFGWPWQRDTLTSMFMPQWAARDFVTVKSVRVERLRDITEEDAKAEGVSEPEAYPYWPGYKHRIAFGELWNAINGKKSCGTWDESPWVWVYEFGNYTRDAGRAMPDGT